MRIEIDPGAGPCFGVKRAIEIAEDTLKKEGLVFCLGDLIHNEQEIERLGKLGMKTISLSEVPSIVSHQVLFRAHGEPPSSYSAVEQHKKTIIDASCPIVVNLQKQIASVYEEIKNTHAQILIYGNKNHPEVISLQGHCGHQAIIIEKVEDIDKVDFRRPIHLFSQTTKYRSDYLKIKEQIKEIKSIPKTENDIDFFFYDSSCKVVAERDQQLKKFVSTKDIIVFVSGTKSSNGQQLFQLCANSATPSYFVSDPHSMKPSWFDGKEKIGVSGATSTPYWLLEKTKQTISEILSNGR